MTQARNNVALRAINPSFSLKSDTEVTYILPLDEFQQMLIQQTTARKVAREATARYRQRRSPNDSSRWFHQQQQHYHQQQQFSSNQLQQQQHQHQQIQQQQYQQKIKQPLSSIDTETTTTPDPVGGRLSKYFIEWTKISNNSYVNTIIQHGYRIPFHTSPPVTTTPTPITPFSNEQVPLIDQAVQSLLQKAAIEPVSPQQVQEIPGFYSSLFVIPKKDDGIRPMFNLKNLNQYLDPPHFKMDTIREVSLMIKPNDYLVSIDLSDAFLHIGLHQDSRRYLRFKWRDQVYRCHPYYTTFGLKVTEFRRTWTIGFWQQTQSN
ncbi:hypothetical protein G6F57_014460 [Rhizopus arrhizus]|uniref:Reverse transcriptase domain-containing protein n=1 Tax=Rhizopus oryzae TaxID=64495 RepID=A0A9P6WX63_RHIOR|nr:hypothetical protein G6F23_011672 [Rhizopus arrhizus]KAG0779452.1 hypothetical protein G6F21_012578 [Rhizopus arrhizus]KAG0804554.1 hypothetical protein G6F20_012605 [Rhizopus arrhizus]KAG0820136.1 hypothetical protein G6F18_012687 [Rhizopus arrhizus]KAG0889225.1 hypothetical protein G6F34_012845 [Rhizopus arrhizus]